MSRGWWIAPVGLAGLVAMGIVFAWNGRPAGSRPVVVSQAPQVQVVPDLPRGPVVPDVSLVDEAGAPWKPSRERGHYTVIAFGCLTCQPFLDQLAPLETVIRDYQPLGVRFVYVYRSLIHPGFNGYLPPMTLADRLLQVREARRRYPTQARWVCDTLDDQLDEALGGAEQSIVVLDPAGRVVHREPWNGARNLRGYLAGRLGAVDPPTPIEAVAHLLPPPPPPLASGVLAPIERPADLVTVIVRPESPLADEASLLRPIVLAEPAILDGQSGKLYLGFHLDRLAGSHWNNAQGPLQWELEALGESQVTPASGEAPRVEAASDADAREFLVTVAARTRGDAAPRLRLRVRAPVCHESAGWCRVVDQSFLIAIERDPRGGWFVQPGAIGH